MEEPRKLKVLFVDDEESSRMVLNAFLSESCDCHMAASGEEALDTFTQAIEQKAPFDLICLDIMMPEMDGLETLQQIRQTEQSLKIPETERCKVIMTTTVSQVSKTMKAFHHGCSAYLVKPIDKNDLFREINKIPFRKAFNTKWRSM